MLGNAEGTDDLLVHGLDHLDEDVHVGVEVLHGLDGHDGVGEVPVGVLDHILDHVEFEEEGEGRSHGLGDLGQFFTQDLERFRVSEGVRHFLD